MSVPDLTHVKAQLETVSVKLAALDRLTEERHATDKERREDTALALKETLQEMNQFRRQIDSERLMYVKKEDLQAAVRLMESSMAVQIAAIKADFEPTKTAGLKLNAAIAALLGLVSLVSGFVGVAASMLWK